MARIEPDPNRPHPAMTPPDRPLGYAQSEVARTRHRQANVAIAACITGGVLAAGLAFAWYEEPGWTQATAYGYPRAVVESVGEVTLDELTSDPARYRGQVVEVVGIAAADADANGRFVIEDTDPELPDEVMVVGMPDASGTMRLGDAVEVHGRVELRDPHDASLGGVDYDTAGYAGGVPVVVADRVTQPRPAGDGLNRR